MLYQAQQVHRAHHDANEVQLSIKTGGRPEDCGYCPQASSADSGIEASKLMPLAEVAKAEQAAKDQGATRFCMGAAWRSPKVRALGLETCMTLGMLDGDRARHATRDEMVRERVRAHDSGCAHHDATGDGAPVSWPRTDGRGFAGFVFRGWSEFHFLW